MAVSSLSYRATTPPNVGQPLKNIVKALAGVAQGLSASLGIKGSPVRFPA